MKVFTHSGDLGDLVYAMPTMQCGGGGLLYLSKSELTRQQPTEQTLKLVAPLFERQPYIAGVALHRGEIPDYNLDVFRTYLDTPGISISEMTLKAFGFPCEVLHAPWLFVEPKPVVEVVINLTERYVNRYFPWRQVVQKYRNKCAFVGLWQEHQNFCQKHGKVSFIETNDLLELARVIAGAKLFVGNHSCPLAIAEGLKVALIQVVPELNRHSHYCMFHRENAGYYMGGGIKLPEI